MSEKVNEEFRKYTSLSNPEEIKVVSIILFSRSMLAFWQKNIFLQKVKEGWDSAEWLKKAVVQMEYQEEKQSFCKKVASWSTTVFTLLVALIHVFGSRKYHQRHSHDGLGTLYSCASERNAEKKSEVQAKSVAFPQQLNQTLLCSSLQSC